MEAALGPLLPLFERERTAGRAMALGVLIDTAGSTYRKPGALILIAADGEYAGLISGGCLEGDLREHAHRVLDAGAARRIRYDLRGSEDALWGLGLGCEGAMEILLLRVGAQEGWQPLQHLAQALHAHSHTAVALVTESARSGLSIGHSILPEARSAAAAGGLPAALAQAAAHGAVSWWQEADLRLFILPLQLPPRVLLLGAGPDAVPVVDIAARLGWKVTLCDHRPAYAVPGHFPAAERVLLLDPATLGALPELNGYDAAVVMSHHLGSDLAYLQALAGSTLPYIGLLGPAVRRERLLQELGPAAQRLQRRLHAPVGLPLGGRSPEAIALAIVAELQGFLYGAARSVAAAPAAGASTGPVSDNYHDLRQRFSLEAASGGERE
jgi:xanthine dehydrogenase accessory factor